MDTNQINFSKIAFMAFPLAGHFGGYKLLFKNLTEKHGVDIYVGKNKGNFEGIFSNNISTNSLENANFNSTSSNIFSTTLTMLSQKSKKCGKKQITSLS